MINRLYKSFISPYLKSIIFSVFCMLVVALSSTLQVWLIQPALDKIFLLRDQKMLIFIPITVILISFIKGVATYYQSYLMRYVGQKVITDLQLKLYKHLLHSDLDVINSHSSGKLISRFTNDILMMRGAVSNLLTGIAKEFLSVIFLIILMFYQNTILSLIAFLVFPLAVIPIIKMGKRMRKISNSTQEELGHYTSKLDESFQGIRTIKSYQKEDFEVGRARTIINKILYLYIRAIKTDCITSPVMETLGGISIAAVIWYGGLEVVNGTTTAGSFFSFIAAFIAAYKPLKSIAGLNTNLQEGLAAANRLFNIFDIVPNLVNKPNASNLIIKRGKVEFSKVSFNYPTKKFILQDLDLTIAGGKNVALVGMSGGGKSTIANLILRFYDVTGGKIFIDGQDLTNLTIESIRNNIAIVSQEIMLFDDTIAANIAYGKSDATKNEIIQAAKIAEADNFIMKMPLNYDAVIGQQGLKLSGGQRQRLSIARAILKNAPILILDEASSALDNITERKIQNNLCNYRQGLTTITIAHRLSTIIEADLIYVIQDGKVVESGDHNELLNLKGSYYMLHNAKEI